MNELTCNLLELPLKIMHYKLIPDNDTLLTIGDRSQNKKIK